MFLDVFLLCLIFLKIDGVHFEYPFDCFLAGRFSSDFGVTDCVEIDTLFRLHIIFSSARGISLYFVFVSTVDLQ